MANDINLYVTLATAGLLGLGMVTAAGLSGWRGWLQLKHDELGGHHPAHEPQVSTNSAASRIEMADLKERIRKLEAIAAGVDL